MCAAQADLAQMPVDVYPSSHATPLGAAACARLALEPDLTVGQAVGDWSPDHTYDPQWSPERAAEHLAGWQAAAVTPRRGELFVFDKLARPKVPRIVLPVPSSRGKGVLVSPTIYGNVMLGPTSEDLTDRTATGTSEDGFRFLLEKGERLMPTLLEEEVTATHAGLRAAIDSDDYLIDLDRERQYLLVGGIRSTGLTSGMAVAEYVMWFLAKCELDLTIRDDLPDPPAMPNLGESGVRPYQDVDRIEADPAYGQIVCFCERVTSGEIRDACSSTIPPADSGLPHGGDGLDLRPLRGVRRVPPVRSRRVPHPCHTPYQSRLHSGQGARRVGRPRAPRHRRPVDRRL